MYDMTSTDLIDLIYSAWLEEAYNTVTMICGRHGPLNKLQLISFIWHLENEIGIESEDDLTLAQEDVIHIFKEFGEVIERDFYA